MQEEHETQDQPEQYYTIREAAELFRVAESTVWRWVDKRRMPAYRLPGGRIRLRKKDVETAAKPMKAKDSLGEASSGREPGQRPDWRQWVVRQRGVTIPLDELIARTRKHKEQMLARRGGKPLPSSVDDLREAREEWGRRLDDI